ncbi:MAG: tetratricopeptide repeat protein [Chloroflexota bacterium]
MPVLQYRSLPLLPASPIGRQTEIEAARRVLLSADARLLTLTGPPGVGKTTLAITVAQSLLDEMPHGAWFVDLASISDPADVAWAIADRLDIRPGRGRAVGRLTAVLRDQAILLVLDNFEQVLDAAPLVAELLSACSRLRILATSRVPLLLRWERELPVPPLALPVSSGALHADALDAPAAALFVERAHAADPYLTVDESTPRLIAEICRRLDGLPLAIELAAGRVRTDSLQAIHRQLLAEDVSVGDGGPLDLLAGGARDLPVRQQTLRQAIDWSYALLPPSEQVLLRRLAIFVGGCSLDAARTVCAANQATIASLIENSLLRRELPDDGEPRVRLLEPIRQFALEQLSQAERDDVRRRHAAFFVALAETAEAGLQGSEQAVWLRRLERDHENLRSALRGAASDGDAETAVRLGGALWRFWWVRGYLDEGMRSLDEALAHADRATPSARAKAFHAAAKLARERGDYDRAADLCRQSLTLFRGLDDLAGVALALNTLANVTGDLGDYDSALQLYEESLAARRACGDRSGTALALHNLAALACARGELARAEVLDEESMALFQDAGDAWGVAIALSNQARTALARGDGERAGVLARESLARRRTLGDHRGTILCLELLADVAALAGHDERAARLLGASEELRARRSFIRPPDEAATRSSGRAVDERFATPALRAAWEAGRALDLNGAIDEALSGPAHAETEQAETELTESPPPADLASDDRRDVAPVPDRATSPRTETKLPLLPRREREVAVLISRGLTNREIARELVIAEGTAANYVRRVMERLGVPNRAGVAAWAVEHGLTVADEPSGTR